MKILCFNSKLNKLKIIELDIEYAAKTDELEYQIALLNLKINGYEIELSNATDANEKNRLSGDIQSATTRLHDLNVRQQQQSSGESIIIMIYLL